MAASGQQDLVEGRSSSPTSRDSVSCTSAIVRMRRTDSSTAAFASAESSRRACRRSSDEIVCRLFFTRWWISRIVASLLSSMRSRRRSSEMSRTSTTPPTHLVVSERAGGSARAPRPRAPARPPRSPARPSRTRARTVWSSKPSSPSRIPTALLCTPTRWSADTAFGDAYSTAGWRREASRRHRRVASPTCSSVSAAIGNSPVADHPGEALEDLEVGALELARLAARPSATTPAVSTPRSAPS